MAVRHGTRKRYGAGCRCDECKEAQRLYQRRYRERVAHRDLQGANNFAPDLEDMGPVEVAVELELAGLPAAQLRPSLAAIATAMAKILDGRVPTPKPAAAKVLVNVLDTLHKGSTQRRGNLALVRTMTKKDGG